jgi:hypothetical protein
MQRPERLRRLVDSWKAVVTVLTERRLEARKRDLLVDEAFAALRARVTVLETQVLYLQHSVVDLTGARRN